jgi:hypothetical protein
VPKIFWEFPKFVTKCQKYFEIRILKIRPKLRTKILKMFYLWKCPKICKIFTYENVLKKCSKCAKKFSNLKNMKKNFENMLKMLLRIVKMCPKMLVTKKFSKKIFNVPKKFWKYTQTIWKIWNCTQIFRNFSYFGNMWKILKICQIFWNLFNFGFLSKNLEKF